MKSRIINFIKRILIIFLYCFYKIKKDKLKSCFYKYSFQNGDVKYLTGWDLDESSLVLDLGGYTGEFSDKIISKFNCNVNIYEPVSTYYKGLLEKYQFNNKVHVFNFGFSNLNTNAIINIEGEASSIIKKSNSSINEIVKILDITEYLLMNPIEIDLLSINIEGAEYDLLDSLINANLMHKIYKMQVQFHFSSEPTYIKRRERIIERILSTHVVKFSFPFIWEGFEIK